MTNPGKNDPVQGEGDYDAARRYDKSAQEFAESGKVDPAAHDAAPESVEQAKKMEEAERVGKSHSKGEGPLRSNKGAA